MNEISNKFTKSFGPKTSRKKQIRRVCVYVMLKVDGSRYYCQHSKPLRNNSKGVKVKNEEIMQF
jgi:hypothetical protein